jgi:hypothetical protein
VISRSSPTYSTSRNLSPAKVCNTFNFWNSVGVFESISILILWGEGAVPWLTEATEESPSIHYAIKSHLPRKPRDKTYKREVTESVRCQKIQQTGRRSEYQGSAGAVGEGSTSSLSLERCSPRVICAPDVHLRLLSCPSPCSAARI